MLTQTDYTVNPNLFQEACQTAPETWGGKTTINKATGNFFYDPWELKEEYKDTVWQTLYDSLPVVKGEARIIVLGPGQTYQSHADIDDRYHLNILGEECYLIDLIREQMHKLEQDGIWYNMDAGMLHTATNFGRRFRIQLVVRHLLKRSKLENLVPVTVRSNLDNLDDSRFLFDNYISSWLNSANKNGFISDFEYSTGEVKFKTTVDQLEYLKSYLPTEFSIS
jgi:hypothetical protein